MKQLKFLLIVLFLHLICTEHIYIPKRNLLKPILSREEAKIRKESHEALAQARQERYVAAQTKKQEQEDRESLKPLIVTSSDEKPQNDLSAMPTGEEKVDIDFNKFFKLDNSDWSIKEAIKHDDGTYEDVHQSNSFYVYEIDINYDNSDCLANGYFSVYYKFTNDNSVIVTSQADTQDSDGKNPLTRVKLVKKITGDVQQKQGEAIPLKRLQANRHTEVVQQNQGEAIPLKRLQAKRHTEVVQQNQGEAIPLKKTTAVNPVRSPRANNIPANEPATKKSQVGYLTSRLSDPEDLLELFRLLNTTKDFRVLYSDLMFFNVKFGDKFKEQIPLKTKSKQPSVLNEVHFKRIVSFIKDQIISYAQTVKKVSIDDLKTDKEGAVNNVVSALFHFIVNREILKTNTSREYTDKLGYNELRSYLEVKDKFLNLLKKFYPGNTEVPSVYDQFKLKLENGINEKCLNDTIGKSSISNLFQKWYDNDHVQSWIANQEAIKSGDKKVNQEADRGTD
jgi:hypothetical protein